MTENYIRPEDVTPWNEQWVLTFLNSARSAEEIAEAIEIPGERDVGIKIGKRILDKRKELGRFMNLKQVDDIPQIGPERFTEIVTELLKIPGRHKPISIEIEKYAYRYWSSTRRLGAPYIILYDADNNHVGFVRCMNDNQQSIPTTYKNEYWGIIMTYERSAFPELIDMLRNEKPVYVVWREDENGRVIHAFISTSKEFIGEEETP